MKCCMRATILVAFFLSVPISAVAGKKERDLFNAIASDDAAAVTALIERRVNVNGRSGSCKTTPLHEAARLENPDILKLLLEAGANPKRATTEKCNQWTPLHYVARYGGSVEAAGLLLDAGADANAIDRDGYTPLLVAARYFPRVGQIILARGGDGLAQVLGINVLHRVLRNSDINTGQSLSLALLNQYPELADKADNAIAWLPHHWNARYMKSTAVAKRLVALGSNPGARTPLTFARTPARAGLTSLHFAALHGNRPEAVPLVEYLLTLADIDPNSTDNNGKTAMHWAAQSGASLVTARLIEAGADPEIQWRGKTAKDIAIEEGHLETEAVIEHAVKQRRLQQIASEQDASARRLRQADVALPMEIRRDKYLVQLTSALKQEDYESALLYIELLKQLGPVAAEIEFFQGEALAVLGDATGAIDALIQYLKNTAPSDAQYVRGHELLLETLRENSKMERLFSGPGDKTTDSLFRDAMLETISTLPELTGQDLVTVGISNSLRLNEFAEAILLFDIAEQIAMPLSGSNRFYYAQALHNVGRHQEAIDQISAYLKEEGSEAQHYAPALELLATAQSTMLGP